MHRLERIAAHLTPDAAPPNPGVSVNPTSASLPSRPDDVVICCAVRERTPPSQPQRTRAGASARERHRVRTTVGTVRVHGVKRVGVEGLRGESSVSARWVIASDSRAQTAPGPTSTRTWLFRLLRKAPHRLARRSFHW